MDRLVYPHIFAKIDFCINYIFESRFSRKFKYDGSKFLAEDKLSHRCEICVSSEIGGRDF